jgi:hypothetical protein
MSELQRFLPADQDLLVGLFYRVGRWMSDADDTDASETSEQKEEAQMFGILTKLSQSKNAGPLCNEIAAEALRQKGSWGRWSKQIDTVIDDVVKAKAVIKGQAIDEEFHLFGRSLVSIATSVARAYREASDVEMEKTGVLGWLSEKKNDVAMAIFDPQAHKDMNISPAEDSALTELIEALKG